jgi:hypothetical protein
LGKKLGCCPGSVASDDARARDQGFRAAFATDANHSRCICHHPASIKASTATDTVGDILGLEQ